MLEVLYRVSRS
jgi:hypothetical protein